MLIINDDKEHAMIFSDKGKHYKQLYETEKQKAIEMTLFKNNKHRDTNETIDLHGLHQSEISHVLDKMIYNIKTKLQNGQIGYNENLNLHKVRIITGKGKHSLNNRSIIYQTVEEYLKKQKIDYKKSHENSYFNIFLS